MSENMSDTDRYALESLNALQFNAVCTIHWWALACTRG